MAKPGANIAQVEFFHVGGQATQSLEALYMEVWGRILDGFELALHGSEERSPVKTVVRFFDETGELTNIARRAERLRQRNEKASDAFFNSTGLRRWWLNSSIRRLAGQSIALKEEVRLLASRRLREAVKASRDVAVEKSDNRFRLARKEELHELVEAAANSTRVWLFVFKPNDLLSDTNVSVAHAR